MNIENKLAGIRVRLLKDYPFFGYISNFVEFREMPEIPTLGISKDLVIDYNPEYISNLAPNELLFAVSHEILHTTMKHLLRKYDRDKKWWNIACDIKVNDILIKSRVGRMPYGWITGEQFGIENIESKSAEEIYDELVKKMNKKGNKGSGEGNENGNESNEEGKDIHIYKTLGNKKLGTQDGQGGENGSQDNTNMPNNVDIEKELDKKIKEITEKAIVIAKMQGNMPGGMERELGLLDEGKVNWRQLLWKYITRELPVDYNWTRPNKKSRSLGIYLPDIIRENLEVVVGIDTSGSIDENIELAEFMSEAISIARSFKNVRITVITCDAEIQDEFLLYNGNIEKAKRIKLHGGGGTDFRPVFERAKELNARLLIYFTDGYGNYPDNEEVRTIWVMTTDYNPPFGQVVRI